ncbi:hypothetical protein [Paractinoplanes maris]|uniref:hypothetical protein n=1 Tax=Paractinoplanes maris TaxID=1734446 RepID=UPI0020209F80|nr:hypothetical protein [Actinoplanes maris]
MDLLQSVSSGPLGLFVGAILGVLVSVMFEDTLLNVRKYFGRRFRRIKAKFVVAVGREQEEASPTFSIGHVDTPLLIVEGDGEQVIDEQRVSVRIEPRFVEVPDEVAAWAHEIGKEQDRLEAEGRQRFWNGKNYAVKGLTISRTIDEERPEICLQLQESDYFTFLATKDHERHLSDGSTLRGKYIGDRDYEDVPPFMSSSFGTNVALISADDQLIVARRSNHVGSRPGVWNSSANEAMSRDLDPDGRNPPDIYRVMRRGIREELGVDEREYLLELLAISLDTDMHQWGALFVGTLRSMKGSEVIAKRSRGVADKFENTELKLIPFDPDSVFRFIGEEWDRNMLAPHTPALCYLALVNKFGRRQVERKAERALRSGRPRQV